MPCYSAITVKINDAARLVDALKAQGWNIESNDENGILAIRKDNAFQALRFRAQGGTMTATGNTEQLPAILRGYAEIGVRQFALRKGYTVTKADHRLTLTGRG